LRHSAGHIGDDFVLRCDGIAEVGVEAGYDGGLGEGLVATHQVSFGHGFSFTEGLLLVFGVLLCLVSERNTSMTASGQMIAQEAQPVQDESFSWAGK